MNNKNNKNVMNKNKAKPIYFSDYFKIDKKKLDELGVFDPILNFDTKFFIEILLIKKHTNPIIRNAYNVFIDFFSNLLKNLKNSSNIEDRDWKQAKRITDFREFKDSCIGYGRNSIFGRGLNFEKILLNAKQIIDDDKYNKAEMFILLPFFEEGVGADKISDMIQHIINDPICEYNEFILKELNIKGDYPDFTDKNHYMLLKNPFSKNPIKLLPKDILSEIPIIESSINNLFEDVTKYNKRLRDTLNREIGDVWQELTKKEKIEALFKELKSNTNLFVEVIEALKEHDFKPYDIDKDYLGRYKWLEYSKLFTNFDPIIKYSDNIDSLNSLKKLVISFIQTFKYIIENRSLYKIFWAKYKSENRYKREDFSQMLFYMNSLFWLENLKTNIDISKDKNIIKFEIKNIILNLHIKHANNPLQDEYMKIVESLEENHLFTVLNFEEKISEPLRYIRIMKKPTCEVFEIDATLKDENDLDIEIIKFDKDDYYLKEKSEAGKKAYQNYNLLRNKVEELCMQILHSKILVSANQLLIKVVHIIENEYPELLENFEPYQTYKRDGIDWTKPTIYRWCIKHFKSFQLTKEKELV